MNKSYGSENHFCVYSKHEKIVQLEFFEMNNSVLSAHLYFFKASFYLTIAENRLDLFSSYF